MSRNSAVDPDEIFLDSENLPAFDRHQLEGRLERPVSRPTYGLFALAFLLAGGMLVFRLWKLTVVQGPTLRTRSENNTLDRTPVLAARGNITDRNDVPLAWNAPERLYDNIPGLAPIVGYVGLPNAEEVKGGAALSTELIGRAGIEKALNAYLRGTHGEKVVERDVHGVVQSEGVQVQPKDGSSLRLSIDSELTATMYRAMEELAHEKGFQGGAGVMMDVRTGELIAAASFPSFDPNVLVTKNEPADLARYNADTRKPFLDRVVAGQYTPGSIVKPIMAIAALNEKIITPEKQILSTGSISIPNQFDKDHPSVFKDWKAHGWVDMRHAIAQSSDVYFYEVGGGYDVPGEPQQEGLGIERIEEYARMFGLGTPTGVEIPGERVGVIPSPQWKAENFNGEPWYLGDTYHTAIGQYGFQVTPLQMVRVVAAIATDGVLVTPTILARATSSPPRSSIHIGIPKEDFEVVKEGMRLGTQGGTSMGLSNPVVKIAGKTGTAELGAGKERVNSWVEGFFPYDAPRYAFAMVMEKGLKSNLVGSTYAMRQVIDWMIVHRPDYLSIPEQSTVQKTQNPNKTEKTDAQTR